LYRRCNRQMLPILDPFDFFRPLCVQCLQRSPYALMHLSYRVRAVVSLQLYRHVYRHGYATSICYIVFRTAGQDR
jgi:hypothetical protein